MSFTAVKPALRFVAAAAISAVVVAAGTACAGPRQTLEDTAGDTLLSVTAVDTSSSWGFEPSATAEKNAEDAAAGTMTVQSSAFAVRLGDGIVVGLYGSPNCIPVLEYARLTDPATSAITASVGSAGAAKDCEPGLVGPFGFKLSGEGVLGATEVTVQDNGDSFRVPVSELGS